MEETKPKSLEHESMSITKNSRGYNWEIKILEINVERIEKINEEMKRRFVNEVNTAAA